MKFTTAEALRNIQAQLGKSQKISDRTITETLETLMPVMVNDDTEIADFVKNVFPVINSANTNYTKDTTDFVKDWETKNPKPIEITPPVTPTGGITVEQLDALFEKRLSPMQQELAGYRSERTTESIFTNARAKFLSDNKIDEGNNVLNVFKDLAFSTAKTKIGSDSRAEDIAAIMKSEFDTLSKRAGIDSPYIPAEGSGNPDAPGNIKDAAGFAAQKAALEAKGVIPK